MSPVKSVHGQSEHIDIVFTNGHVVGLWVGLLVIRFASALGFERDRSFYPTVLIVVASYYLLFAAMGGAFATFAAEAVVFVCFLWLATLAAKRSRRLVAMGLIAHGLYDLLHSCIVANPVVPDWWPGFCLTFDLTVAAGLLCASKKRAEPAQRSAP